MMILILATECRFPPLRPSQSEFRSQNLCQLSVPRANEKVKSRGNAQTAIRYLYLTDGMRCFSCKLIRISPKKTV